MPSKPPKPQQAPFQQQQQQQTTYGRFSIADSPEAQEFLGVPLDFGGPVDVDPGVARRTDLAEQEAENRYNSAFNSGVPRFAREANYAKEQRDIRGQGAYEAAQANYLNQQGNNEIRARRTMAELQRRQLLLPQYLQTGGSGSASGYNTQFPQSQPGFWQKFGLGLIGNGADAARMYAGGGYS